MGIKCLKNQIQLLMLAAVVLPGYVALATKNELEPVSAWLIVASGVSAPPKGEYPIDWKLLTDLEVSSFEDAMEKIDWYTKRFASMRSERKGKSL